MSLETLCKVADALHVSLSELVAFGTTPTDDLLVREVADLVKARAPEEHAELLAVFQQIAKIGAKGAKSKKTPRKG